MKAKNVAVVWVNNDFGKGGRDNFKREMDARGIKIAADISTESGQADFAADVLKAKAANADAMFVYTNEEEGARFLREARKQGSTKPLIGETTLLGQKVIELAGDAANGARGTSASPPTRRCRRLQEFKTKFKRASSTCRTTTASRATPACTRQVATEKIGKFDSKAFAEALHGMKIPPKDEPGMLIEATLDDERRHRPRELPRQGRRRQAEDHERVAEAGEVSHRSVRPRESGGPRKGRSGPEKTSS